MTMNDVIGKTQMLVRRWLVMFALPLVFLLAVGGAVIGAPQGQPGAMTTGEVLATGISLPGVAGGNFVRVSARVQPGESGAPLLNSQAQVVGVVVATTFDRSRARGGLAVSLQTIQAVLPQLRQGARVERA